MTFCIQTGLVKIMGGPHHQNLGSICSRDWIGHRCMVRMYDRWNAFTNNCCIVMKMQEL